MHETEQFERLQCWYYWWERFMKHAIEMTSSGMIYFPSLIKTGSDIQKLEWQIHMDTYTQATR
jgi:hypothetical protein